MLVVDPWDWLDSNGEVPTKYPGVRKNLLAVLRVIEYGSLLRRGTSRDTLIECNKRPSGRRRLGLLRVEKTEDDRLFAFCPECETEHMLVSNWQGTRWSHEPRQPAVRNRT